MTSKKRLGRALSDMGVEALLSSVSNDINNTQIQNISLERITPNQHQPRKTFNAETLSELSESIKEHGVIQPIVITKKTTGDFEIIAGERRYRAAKLAGLTDIPSIVKNLDDLAAESIAIIENIQREDLNPLDQAVAYARLVEIYQLSHDEIAKKVHKSRSSISNILRLIKLHPEVKEHLKSKTIEMGHARALLAAPYLKQPELAKLIIQRQLTVRQVENLLKAKTPSTPKQNNQWISEQLQMLPIKTSVRGSEQKGKITLQYDSPSDLNKILTLLTHESLISD